MSFELTFDEATHRYFVGGVEYPSVTTVLSSVGIKSGDFWRGLVDYSFLSADLRDGALRRGTWVADLCSLRSKRGPLPELFLAKLMSLHPTWFGYYDAFERFLSESGFEPAKDFVERPGCSIVHGYAGRPDLPGKLQGKTALLDLKTGSAPVATEYQVAAYSLIEPAPFPSYAVLGALELHEDGTYKLITYRNHARARAIWLSILNVYREGIAIHGNANPDANA